MKKPGIKKTVGLMAMLSLLSLNTAALPGQEQPPRKDPVSERFKKEDFQKTWRRNAEKMGVEFTLPSYMREVPVEFRAALSIRYQRGFVHPRNKMQVRYALFQGERDFNPLNPIMLRVIAMNSSGGAENFKPVSVPPDVAAGRYGADGGVLVERIKKLLGSDEKFKITPIDRGDARREFGADRGVFIYGRASSFSAFARGYRMVVVMGLEKEDAPYLFVFLLVRNQSAFSKPAFREAFESARFRHISKKKKMPGTKI